MEIFKTSGVTIVYQEQDELLLISWLKKPSSSKVREAYLHALQFVAEHSKVKMFCTDQTQIGPLEREHENWLNHEYYPKVYQIIKDEIFAAVVFSETHFNALVTNYQVQTSLPQQHFIQFNYFTDLQEAMDWLADIKKGQDMTASPA